jgi:Thiamine pyrophosphate-requiring enzymes [acetolactate synthase, pyruvate dehydrogenase (cytochrome), glyoxylate carboligase, phosphonopyruvate decarboxylase]
MKRIQAMKLILEAFPDEPVISNCGATCRELAYLERSGRILYLEDSMGLASSVGLGLALALADKPVKRVIVMEGDGSLLMNFSSLASTAYYQPAKLLLVVLDNGVYASTGGQTTYSSKLNLALFAQAGQLTTLVAGSESELQACLTQIVDNSGCVFLHIRIESENTASVPWFLEDPAVLGHTFSQWIQDRTRL